MTYNKSKYFKITDTGKLSTSEMMDSFKKKFKVWCYWDNLDKNFPAPKKKTVRYFLKQQDPDILNVSFNDMKGKEFMTLREYMIAFEQYFNETGKYLDEKGWTIFSDTGLSDGDVAYGGWYLGYRGVGFYWDGPGYRYSYGGARVAISPQNLTLVPSATDEQSDCTEEQAIQFAIDKVKKAGYQVSKIL